MRIPTAYTLLLYIAAAIPAAAAPAQPVNNPEGITATVESRLAESETAVDSILLLENIYDLAFRYRPAVADSLARRIYLTAALAGDTRTALDMVRQRANMGSRNDSLLTRLREQATSFPAGTDRDITLTFIDMLANYNSTHTMTEEKRQQHLERQLREYTVDRPDDLYKQIVLLHSICVNIASDVKGGLLSDYIDRLGELIDSLPDDSYALRNMYNVQAAIAYSEAEHPRKAIEADRRLLADMDAMEEEYARLGRPYRNFDGNRYVAYTRILSNWKQLSRQELEEAYRRAIYYRDRAPRAANTYRQSPRPDIYYAMATGDHVTALRLIKECIDRPANAAFRRRFLAYMIECARALGDDATVLEASDEYVRMLENEVEKRSRDRYRELQIVYEVQGMKSQINDLSEENVRDRLSAQRNIIYISAASILLLLVMMFFVVRSYRRAKHLAASLSEANAALKSETANLRISRQEMIKARDAAERASNFKSDFIKGLSREVAIPLKAISEYSHLITDCTDSTGKPYLQRYAKLVDQNCALVTSIASDILHMAEIESDTLEVTRSYHDLGKTITTAVDSAATRLPSDIKIAIDPEAEPVDIYTDPVRLQQVLLNLIANSAKFISGAGNIHVGYTIDTAKGMADIYVTDTGIGVPAEQAERIFERFVKLDPDKPGAGLGLTIARMLARLLGGDLRLDTSHHPGARFVISLPLRAK